MEDQTKAGSAAAPTSPSSAPRSGAQTEDPVATSTAGEPTGAHISSDDHQATATMVSTSDSAASKPVRDADPIAELAASCAIENSFSHDVLRQSNVTLAGLGGDEGGRGGGRERMVCTTDAEKGAAAFAAAEDSRLRREKEARKAKEREAKEKAKIPSLKDFKSDIAAKVSAAKAAKEEPKEHKEPQKDKEPKEPKEPQKDKEPKEHKEGHAADKEPNVADQNATGADQPDAAGDETDADDTGGEGNANRTGSDVAGSIPGDANSTATTEEERERRAGAAGAAGAKGAGSAKGGAKGAAEENQNRGERRGGGDEKAVKEPASEPLSRDDAAPDGDAVAGDAGARSSAEPAHPGAAEEDEGGFGGGGIDARSEPAAPAASAAAEDQPAAAPAATPAGPGAADGDPAAAAPADAPATAPEDPEDPEDPWLTPASAAEGEAFIRQYNYASYANGARVVSSNPEAKSAGAALKEDMDSYYLTPCAAKNGRWLTVELSEEAAVTAVTLANYEFHSSGVREFEVWASAGGGGHDREEDWRRLGRCRARDGRDVQTFVLPRGHWSKYVRVSMTSHYGRHHFCTLSLLRVHGKDAKQTLEEEMEAINREVAEVEEILNAGDDHEPAGEAVQSGGGSGDDDKPAAEDEVQAADADSPAEPEAAPEPPIEPSIGTPDGTPTAPPTELPADAGAGATSEAKPRGESDSAGADAASKADDNDKKEGFFKSWFGKEKEAASKEAASKAASKEQEAKEASKEAAKEEAGDSPPRPDHALADPAAAASKSRSDEEKEDDGGGSGGEDAVGFEPPASAETDAGSSERSSSEEVKPATADVHPGTAEGETPTTTPGAEAAAQPIQPKEPEEAGAAAKEQQPPTVGKDDRPLPAVPKSAVSEQPRPSSPENVFSLMAKKIKSLELNQSMFDRYIESLSSSYGGRFEDIAQEVNDLEELVANQTSALVELDKAIERAARGAKSDLSVAVERVGRDSAKNARETAADIRDRLAIVERRWELYLGLTMFAVATVLGVAAAASGAQAALVLWREGSEPAGSRARLAAKVTAACCVVAGALSLGCYFAAAWLVFGRVATSACAAGLRAAGAAFGYLRMNRRT